jgi:hypothetical protein
MYPLLDSLYGSAYYLESCGQHEMASEIRKAARELIEARGINRLLTDIIRDAPHGEFLGDLEDLPTETLQ